jgi:hypothetical protein
MMKRFLTNPYLKPVSEVIDYYYDNDDNEKYVYTDYEIEEIEEGNRRNRNKFLTTGAALAIPIILGSGAYYFFPRNQQDNIKVEDNKIIEDNIIEDKIEEGLNKINEDNEQFPYLLVGGLIIGSYIIYRWN